MTSRSTFIALVGLAALTAPTQAQDDLGPVAALFGDPRVDAPVVSFQLRDDVTAPADIARFTVAVVSDADSAEAALRANSAATETVIAALREQGLTDAEFRSSRVSVDQRRGGRSSNVRGYTASNRISVETRSVDRASVMIAAAVAAGATNVDGPSFDREDMAALLSPLRATLFSRAQAQASDYARAAGYARVRPISMSERVTAQERYESYGIVAESASAAMDGVDIEEMAPPTPSTDVTRTLALSISFRMER